jgi:hypothetical protein
MLANVAEVKRLAAHSQRPRVQRRSSSWCSSRGCFLARATPKPPIFGLHRLRFQPCATSWEEGSRFPSSTIRSIVALVASLAAMGLEVGSEIIRLTRASRRRRRLALSGLGHWHFSFDCAQPRSFGRRRRAISQLAFDCAITFTFDRRWYHIIIPPVQQKRHVTVSWAWSGTNRRHLDWFEHASHVIRTHRLKILQQQRRCNRTGGHNFARGNEHDKNKHTPCLACAGHSCMLAFVTYAGPSDAVAST